METELTVRTFITRLATGSSVFLALAVLGGLFLTRHPRRVGDELQRGDELLRYVVFGSHLVGDN